jgi:hypothetical protein
MAERTGNPKFTHSPGTTSPGAVGFSPDRKRLYWTGDGNWPDDWFTLHNGSNWKDQLQYIRDTRFDRSWRKYSEDIPW